MSFHRHILCSFRNFPIWKLMYILEVNTGKFLPFKSYGVAMVMCVFVHTKKKHQTYAFHHEKHDFCE